MKTLCCLVVEDEPLPRELLENYINKTPGLNLCGSADNGFDALELITSQNPDILFLDIRMPELTGISVLKALEKPPLTVFTTAYPEYAVDGFDLNVLDFLLKPFEYERFIKTIEKAKNQLSTAISIKAESESLFLKVDKKLIKLSLSEVLYLQAYGDFVKVFTSEEKFHLITDTLKSFEGQLAGKSFCRIHKSYVINLSKIEFIEGNQVKIGEAFLPIGQAYRERLLGLLK